jgi:hypothetical protein
MIQDTNTQFPVSQNDYIAFDAVTMKDFIVEKLKTNSTFTDQIYDGSNLSSIIEIVAYSYNVLMFYLNTTSAESTFSQASLYENMNKIVNLIGYKPTGRQTSICTINATANSSLPIGNYVLRRYSYVLVDDIQYTFLQDYSFSKETSGDEDITSISDNALLYQGSVEQYPVYTAAGEEFETIPIVVDNIVDTVNERFIAAGSIGVYVKEKATGKYYKYEEVSNLYLAQSYDRVYDLRLNENGNYEVKFGNTVFGRQLEAGDEVVVYYILSDNVAGVISQNEIDGNKIFTYTTNLFETIFADTNTFTGSTLVNTTNSAGILLVNPINSTVPGASESVDEIRKNVPGFVAANLRLVTSKDYTNFYQKNISNIVQSVYVASNREFIDQYINYFYNISVDPNKVNRVLLNQVNYADSCDFNNVNVFCVPKFTNTLDNKIPEYLSSAFKNLLVDSVDDLKMVCAEVVPRDPIYVAYKLGISNTLPLREAIANSCKLVVVRENNNKIQKDALKLRVVNIIKDFFSPANNTLGQVISLSTLTSNILSVVGIKNVYTYNSAENIRFDGVSFLQWNPLYPEDDISILNQDTTLPFYKFPYLAYPQTIANYIEVVDE